jgi:hypothetical protein
MGVILTAVDSCKYLPLDGSLQAECMHLQPYSLKEDEYQHQKKFL